MSPFIILVPVGFFAYLIARKLEETSNMSEFIEKDNIVNNTNNSNIRTPLID